MVTFNKIFSLLRVSSLHDYPMVTIRDNDSLYIETSDIRYQDMKKLANIEVVGISTWLPFTIWVDCSFKELDIKGARKVGS